MKKKIAGLTLSAVLFILYSMLLTPCSSAEAQQGAKIPRVGILFIGGRDQPHLEAFKRGLRERGYTEGKNILIEYRYAEVKEERLPELAAELAQLKVDVIVATADISAQAAQRTTKNTPIVLTTGDPIAWGPRRKFGKARRQCHGTHGSSSGFKREAAGNSQRGIAKNDKGGCIVEPKGESGDGCFSGNESGGAGFFCAASFLRGRHDTRY